jgi:hypothetical protein
MPIHEWRCKNCDVVVDVTRRIGDHSVEPTQEEVDRTIANGPILHSSNKLSEEDRDKARAAIQLTLDAAKKCKKFDWIKQISSPPQTTYGAGWSPHGFGGGKGNW